MIDWSKFANGCFGPEEIIMRIQQIKFRFFDEDTTYGGILIDNKFVICGCCGGIVDIKGVEILEKYTSWVNLSEFILGD